MMPVRIEPLRPAQRLLSRERLRPEAKTPFEEDISQTEPRRPTQLRGENVWVALILVAHLLLSIGFSLGPLFEGPDEIAHYKFVRYLIERRNLPGPPYEFGTGGETHQAPLYYLINGLIALGLPDGDFAQRVGRSNPYHGVEAGNASNFNKNSRFHYLIEAFPYTQSQTTLALHILRLTSVLFSLCAVAASYLIVKRLWPDRADLRMVAFGLVAFWPQNLYLSGTLNNDNLVLLAATLALLWLLRQSDQGPSWPRTVCLGLALGFGILAKSSAVFLVLPVGAALLLDRRTWRTLPLLTLVVLLAGGWWYIRNMFVYGEPTGYTLFFQFVPATRIPPGTLTFWDWLARAPYVYSGAWATFGDGAVGVSPEGYIIFDLLLGLMLVGLVAYGMRVWRKARRATLTPESLRRGLIVGLYTVSWFAAVGYIAYTSWLGVSGRVILPSVVGLAIMMALGIMTLTPERLRIRVALSTICFMAFVAAVCLFGYFRFSYQPEVFPNTTETPLAYNFEGQAEIIGAQSGLVKAQPGDIIHVKIYWRALQPTENEVTTFLHTVESKSVHTDSFPGDGNLMSSEWMPGQMWTEVYRLRIPANASRQTILTLFAGLYDPQNERTLTATDPGKVEVLPVVGRLAINGPIAPFEPDYRFGSAVGLAKPIVERQGDALKVCLKWLSIAPVTTDFHEFVHVLSSNDTLIGQFDSDPKEGHYPTSAWVPGETINDCVTVETPNLPEKGWRVTTGLYNLVTGERLPVVDRAGQVQINGEVVWTP